MYGAKGCGEREVGSGGSLFGAEEQSSISLWVWGGEGATAGGGPRPELGARFKGRRGFGANGGILDFTDGAVIILVTLVVTV